MKWTITDKKITACRYFDGECFNCDSPVERNSAITVLECDHDAGFNISAIACDKCAPLFEVGEKIILGEKR